MNVNARTALVVCYAQPPGAVQQPLQPYPPPAAQPVYSPPPPSYGPPPPQGPAPGHRGNPLPGPLKKFHPFFLFGIILLMVGIIMAAAAGAWMGSAKSISSVKGDFDSGKGMFTSYHTGDKIIISGTITDKDADSSSGYGTWTYELDEASFFVHSDENLGNIGDSVLIEMTVKEKRTTIFGYTVIYQYLGDGKGVPAVPLLAFGLIMLMVGLLLVLVWFLKFRTPHAPPPPMYPQEPMIAQPACVQPAQAPPVASPSGPPPLAPQPAPSAPPVPQPPSPPAQPPNP